MMQGAKATAFSLRMTSAAAFLLPALALWVPSGYSYAALLLLLGALCFAPAWLRRGPDRYTLGLCLLMVGMGCMWFVLTLDVGVNRWDKGIKWLLGALCLLYLAAYPPRPSFFRAGLPIGCVGMGCLALWQVFHLGLDRANGFTNAIQWGNLALLLACLTAVLLAVFWRPSRWPWRLGMMLAVVLGFAASLLSQSRGGWLAVLAVVPLWLWWVWRIRPQRFGRLLGALALALAALALVLAFTPRFNDRVEQAAAEITGYVHSGQENTSVGNRLAQYHLVADMIPAKPWLGWGAHGFVQEMQRRVDAGEYAPQMMHYPEVHNIFLDAWVKVGVGGVLLQAVLLGWVLVMFWPSRQRLARHATDSPPWREALALRVMGSTVPVCYFVFGLSQPFFNHNSGIMCFVFYVAVLWAALQGVEGDG
ncbi:MAG TPA: O-antigen ligase family protein [Acidovorax sp.]|nr:O-antigen ligase family protein [Acidovorax sp.]